MAENESFIAQMFLRLTNLFYLMVGLSLLAFGWVYLNGSAIHPAAFFEHPVYAWFWHLPVFLLIVGLTAGAWVRYRKQLKKFFSESDTSPSLYGLKEKAEVFYRISLTKYLMLTAAGLLTILSLYISGHGIYTAIFGIQVLIFSISRPGGESFARDLKLNKEERGVVREELKKLR